MRRRLGCRLFAAAVAAAVLHGAASAGDPPAVVAGSGGCPSGDCGGFGGPGRAAGHRTAHRGFVMGNAATGYFTDRCPYGALCNNGCGSFRSDAGFVLGSCRSFFAPCGPGMLDFGHGRGCGGGLFGKCHKGGPGVPSAGAYEPCRYDSYANH